MKRIADAVISLKSEHMGIAQPVFVQILDDLIKANPNKGYTHLRTLEAIPDMTEGRTKYVSSKRDSKRCSVYPFPAVSDSGLEPPGAA